jgi:hypothetical protein
MEDIKQPAQGHFVPVSSPSTLGGIYWPKAAGEHATPLPRAANDPTLARGDRFGGRLIWVWPVVVVLVHGGRGSGLQFPSQLAGGFNGLDDIALRAEVTGGQCSAHVEKHWGWRTGWSPVFTAGTSRERPG